MNSTNIGESLVTNSIRSLPEAFIVDIDGTLALHDGFRNPYAWQHADRDRPNPAVVRIVQALALAGVAIVYLSGRPEAARSLTLDWIEQHVGVEGTLFLRTDDDSRKDAVVKREIYENSVAKTYSVIGVIDDRQQVVNMWRDELGLTCLQVARGDF